MSTCDTNIASISHEPTCVPGTPDAGGWTPGRPLLLSRVRPCNARHAQGPPSASVLHVGIRSSHATSSSHTARRRPQRPRLHALNLPPVALSGGPGSKSRTLSQQHPHPRDPSARHRGHAPSPSPLRALRHLNLASSRSTVAPSQHPPPPPQHAGPTYSCVGRRRPRE